MLKRLPRARNRNWIAALLILVNQHGQQFGEFRFLRRKIFTLVKTQQFVRETFTFFVGVDDMRECTAQQFPVSFRVEIYRCRAHWFQAPLSYSACVNKTKGPGTNEHDNDRFRRENYRCRAHWFQAPLSYSACVNKYRTKTR